MAVKIGRFTVSVLSGGFPEGGAISPMRVPSVMSAAAQAPVDSPLIVSLATEPATCEDFHLDVPECEELTPLDSTEAPRMRSMISRSSTPRQRSRSPPSSQGATGIA